MLRDVIVALGGTTGLPRGMNFLFKLAWASRINLPLLITLGFMITNIHVRLDINIRMVEEEIAVPQVDDTETENEDEEDDDDEDDINDEDYDESDESDESNTSYMAEVIDDLLQNCFVENRVENNLQELESNQTTVNER